MKRRRHQIYVTVTFDRPVTREIAARAMNATMRGNVDYPPYGGEFGAPEEVKIGAFSTRPSKAGKGSK